MSAGCRKPLEGPGTRCHSDLVAETLSVAEAKRRFSELIERVQRGEQIIVARRGRPAVALVAPEPPLDRHRDRPLGLAAIAGSLADWTGLEAAVETIYAERRRDHRAPRLR